MPDKEFAEISPGLYIASELPKFDQHQAWTKQFDIHIGNPEVVHVGDDERVRLPTRLQHGVDMSREGSNIYIVQNILQRGEFMVRLQSFTSAVQAAEKGIEQLPVPNVYLESIVDELAAEVEAERLRQIEAKVTRAANFIAEHPSLWIVTKHRIVDPTQPDIRGVGVARLVGMAVAPDTKLTDTPPQAVVAGKNGRKAQLSSRRSNSSPGRPEVKTVLKGIGRRQ